MKSILLNLLLIVSFGIQATNRYVGKTGSDSNSGTISSRYLTIQKGADVALPGDSIIVGDGVYTTSTDQIILITSGGTSGNKIVFKSEHKYGAILDGQNGTTLYPIQFGTSASYIDIVDFEMRNFHRGIWANNATNPSNFITLKGNKIHDFGRNQVDGGGGLYVGRSHHDWTITKNMFYNIGNTSTTATLNLDHAIYVIITAPTQAETPYNFEISYNIFFGVSGDAVQVGFYNSKIVNNTFAWSNENSAGGRGFIVTDSPTTYGGRYITVANNIFYQALSSNSYSLRSYSTVTGWVVKNNMNYGGRMWYEDTSTSDITSASGGNNYGQADCEHPEVNPLFIYAIRSDATSANFQLQSLSPAINAGVNLGYTADFLSNAIIGLPDIGAYEYQPAVPAPTTPKKTKLINRNILQGEFFDFSGSNLIPSDSLSVSDTLQYIMPITHTNGIDPYMSTYWSKIGSGTATLTVNFYQANDQKYTNFVAVKKGKLLNNYSKILTLSASGWSSVSFVQDTAKFEGRYLMIEFVTDATLNVKGKLFNRMKLNTK